MIRPLLTPAVKKALRKFARTKDAFAPQALEAQGVPALVIRAIVVAENQPPMKARVSLTGRARIETKSYVWGPDVAAHLKGWE